MGTYNLVAYVTVEGEEQPRSLPLAHSANTPQEALDQIGNALGQTLKQGFFSYQLDGKQMVVPARRITEITVELAE